MPEVYVQRIGGWNATMKWPDGAESGGPMSLVIEPSDENNPPVGGLSSTVLRAVDFRSAVSKLDAFFQMAKEENSQRDKSTGDVLRKMLGDSGITNEYLVKLCMAYIGLVSRGRNHPTEYLAELIGKSANTVKGHLWQAKNRELFVGSGGRVGGELTAKGQRIAWEMVGLDPDDFTEET